MSGEFRYIDSRSIKHNDSARTDDAVVAAVTTINHTSEPNGREDFAHQGVQEIGPTVWAIASLVPLAFRLLTFLAGDPSLGGLATWCSWWLIPAVLLWGWAAADHEETRTVRADGWVGGEYVHVTAEVPTGAIIRGSRELADSWARTWVISMPYLNAYWSIWEADIRFTRFANLDSLLVDWVVPVTLGLLLVRIYHEAKSSDYAAYRRLRIGWRIAVRVGAGILVLQLLRLFVAWLFE